MTDPAASHRRNVVHPHRFDTLGILVAGQEPCISVATEQALRQSGRRFVILDPAAVRTLAPPPSWAMAVLLCPGDDTALVAAWGARINVDPSRIAFYYHPKVDVRKALRAWDEAGLPAWNTWEVASWKDLSRKFGAILNNVCHDDFCADGDCRFRERARPRQG